MSITYSTKAANYEGNVVNRAQQIDPASLDDLVELLGEERVAQLARTKWNDLELTRMRVLGIAAIAHLKGMLDAVRNQIEMLFDESRDQSNELLEELRAHQKARTLPELYKRLWPAGKFNR